jgi:hypothetical protein
VDFASAFTEKKIHNQKTPSLETDWTFEQLSGVGQRSILTGSLDLTIRIIKKSG